ncbi:hypothetical protein [Micromonospora yangpuensis]|uniref:Uncharacterized protein n=1 Tax=Micromonospora yangpuensis TaxID=683228 RepID=A0A1C6US17_9ACTN|nr:hypothetical protein [Micromonospora yangpuensis]GGM06913.1 hypothetical protein GCM10012279_26090 [Micromonospora yangpuensis]SCL56643.1 hypothetical protein GA0070617_3295 [Micromonospora yangpuensis]
MVHGGVAAATAQLSGREIRRPTAPPATRGEDLVTVLLAACLVGGAQADGWAHTNVIETIEGFFTPWHGLLYAGFAATAAWTFWLAYRRRMVAPRWWRDGWPAGYRTGALGVVAFGLAALADLTWHETLGVEVGLDASFSPSHLLLDGAALLVVSSPLRSWWARGEGGLRTVTGVAALTLAAMTPTILLSHSSALLTLAPTRPLGPTTGQLVAVLGVDAYLVTTVLLVVPYLLVHRRRAVPGAGVAVVAGVAVFALGMYEFPTVQTVAALGAICGAGLADLLLHRLDAVRGRSAALRLPVAGAVFAGLVWSGHLLGLALADQLRWTPEVVSGVVTLSAILGAVLGGLAARPLPGGPSTDGARPHRV